MSQTKMMILGLVVVLVLIGGYFAFKSKGDNNSAQNAQQNSAQTSQTGATSNGKKVPFSQFLSQGGTYKCTVDQNVNNVTTKGTVYIDNKLIRGEYNTKVQGMSIDSTLVVRDGYTYTWSSAAPTMGFKTKLTEKPANQTENGVTNQTTTGTSGSYSFNSEQIGDYTCERWVADPGKFTIPVEVKFQEVK